MMWDDVFQASPFAMPNAVLILNSDVIAYFLMQYTFQLQSRKIYMFFSPKWTYLTSLLFSEVGSFICALALSLIEYLYYLAADLKNRYGSRVFLQQAVTGTGSSDVSVGSLVIITQKRLI
ncbi:hypothetical protein F5X99DRAFT_15788 [Biscogniauxia marginata]|nr:hypothetical protein F5X99DRAFT_15788 [Biscogniauxia marginata]